MRQVFPLAPSSSGWQWLFLLILIVFMGWLVFILISPNKGSVVVEDSHFTLRVPMYGRTIPLSMLNLPESRVVDLSVDKNLGLKWRTNGIGLPRYLVGWFRLNDGQKALAAVTDPHHVVYIPTRDDYSILVSVMNPNAFLNALKEHVTGTGF